MSVAVCTRKRCVLPAISTITELLPSGYGIVWIVRHVVFRAPVLARRPHECLCRKENASLPGETIWFTRFNAPNEKRPLPGVQQRPL
jgi:hypothetical protein